jgi:ABC-type transport system involved in multi-copper enzyme maturation permease subunit
VREKLAEVLTDFAIFHSVLFLVTSSWAVLRLRRIALKEAGGAAGSGQSVMGRLLRPGVSSQPMLWKELFVEGGVRFGRVGRIIVGLLVLGSFVPIIFIIQGVVLDYSGSERMRERLGWAMNVYVRIVGMFVAFLTLLAVAVRAAGCLSGERDRQTFDGLMTTPLEAPSILFAKWLGCIASVRLAWLWLGLIWMLGAISNGLHPGAVPLLLVAWLVYAGVFACVGMWYSLVCRTTLRATMWTLLTTIGLGIGHWVLTLMCCILPVAAIPNTSGRDVEYIAKFQVGQTPPAVFVVLAFRGEEMSGRRIWDETLELFGFSVLGLGTWIIGGLVLAAIISHRFQEMTLRQDTRSPETDQQAARPALPPPVSPPPMYEAIPVEDNEPLTGEQERIQPQPGSDGS